MMMMMTMLLRYFLLRRPSEWYTFVDHPGICRKVKVYLVFRVCVCVCVVNNTNSVPYVAFVNLSIIKLFCCYCYLWNVIIMRSLQSRFISGKKTKIAFVMAENWNIMPIRGRLRLESTHILCMHEFDNLTGLVIHVHGAMEVTNCWCTVNSTLFALWYRQRNPKKKRIK